MAAVSTMISDFNVIELDGEPRIRDTDLAERLEMPRPERIRKKIEQNAAELRFFGLLGAVREYESRGRSKKGKAITVYHPNEGQALTLCSFIRTERAAKVRQALVVTFMAWRQGRLLQAASPEMIRRIAEDTFENRLQLAAFDLIQATVSANMNPSDAAPRLPKGYERLGDFLERKGLCRLRASYGSQLSKSVRKYCSRHAFSVLENVGSAYRSGLGFPTAALEDWWDAGGKGASQFAAHKSAVENAPLFNWAIEHQGSVYPPEA